MENVRRNDGDRRSKIYRFNHRYKKIYLSAIIDNPLIMRYKYNF